MKPQSVAKMAFESLDNINTELTKYHSLKSNFPECYANTIFEIEKIVSRYIGIFAHLQKAEDGSQQEMA